MAKKSNPGPFVTTMASSAVGGAFMQIGAAVASKFLDRKKARNKNPDATIRALKNKLLR